MTTSTAFGNHPWRYVGWNTGGVNNTLVGLEVVYYFTAQFSGKYLGAETGKEWQTLNCVSKTANTRRATCGHFGCTFPDKQA
jgi:hypothetical protein